MACWYASAQMLIQWRRKRRQATEMAFADPSEVPELARAHVANNGLPVEQNVKLAKLLGLQPVPLMTPTEDAIYQWLRSYGPIWAAGKFGSGASFFGHVAVIVGISNEGLQLNDPWPPNAGSRYKTGFKWLTTLLDVDWDFAPNFLHFP
jgi:hypothetical protein